jgi:hypothetical protein
LAGWAAIGLSTGFAGSKENSGDDFGLTVKESKVWLGCEHENQLSRYKPESPYHGTLFDK